MQDSGSCDRRSIRLGGTIFLIMPKLEDIRKKINSIDSQLVELFEQRMEASREVAEYKMERGLSVYDPQREAEVIKRNAELIKSDEIREYFMRFEQNLMDLSKDYQYRRISGLKVAYSGVEGAFAYVAARKMFPSAQLVSYPDFQSAYQSCSSGESDVVVLPFENSYAGEVSAVTDLMFSGDLYVNQVVQVEAVQNLLACPDAQIDDIKAVVSHPQALSQCAEYIREKGYAVHEYSNTALAARMVAQKGDCSLAAIANAECAELYGLKILEHRINESSNNTTRFAAFSKVLNTETAKRKMGKHFILMFTVKNEAGALAKTLNIIGSHNYNMCALRSRPTKELLWSYYFYIELDGNIYTEEGKSMLRELGTLCEKLKLVGSF